MTDKAEETIDLIQAIRIKMNRELRAMENAKFRMSLQKNSNGDNTWQLVYSRQSAAYAKSYQTLQDLIQTFFSLKPSYSSEEWERLLGDLGHTLALTENIPHVVDNMFDEKDLIEALDKTSEAIKTLNGKLKLALESGNSDQTILIASQLQYYEDDMRQHHWGDARLTRIHLDDDTYTNYLKSNIEKSVEPVESENGEKQKSLLGPQNFTFD